MKCNNLQVKSLLDATESKIQVGFTTGRPALKALQWSMQQLSLSSTEE
jgi:hydroxymethylpyrimidine pyrophosphatase-like HAD family hydrolase